MCGIVGYIGPRQATPIIFEGLSGWNIAAMTSAGIAVIGSDGKHRRPARCGQTGQSRTQAGRAAARRPRRHRPHALGHARLAQRANAHPHTDCTATWS